MKLNKLLGAILLAEILAGFSLFVAAQNPPGAYNSPAQGGSVTATAIGAVCGADTQVLFNSAGSCSGDANFTVLNPGTVNANVVIGSATAQGNGLQVLTLRSFSGGGALGPTPNANGTLSVKNAAGTVVASIGGSGDWNSNIVRWNTANTGTNCAVNSVSPAACAAAAAGSFVVPTTTTTYTVNTTRVTANSRIFLFPHTDTRDLPSAPTCVVPAITAEPVVTATVAATSFTLALASTTGQTCWDYFIIN